MWISTVIFTMIFQTVLHCIVIILRQGKVRPTNKAVLAAIRNMHHHKCGNELSQKDLHVSSSAEAVLLQSLEMAIDNVTLLVAISTLIAGTVAF